MYMYMQIKQHKAVSQHNNKLSNVSIMYMYMVDTNKRLYLIVYYLVIMAGAHRLESAVVSVGDLLNIFDTCYCQRSKHEKPYQVLWMVHNRMFL